MPASAAHQRFAGSLTSARVLTSFVGGAVAGVNQQTIDQACMVASVACAVGCWEGYVEAVLREFVAKTRVHAHSRAWPLITQFEVMVEKATADLNTPSWDKAREILVRVSGVDPYAAWIWAPKFATQNDTKDFFDGLMRVRHSFAHGFPVPANIGALGASGLLTQQYVADVLACLEFFATTTDGLLEHELKHKHGVTAGW